MKRFYADDLYIKLLMLFPIFTLFQSFGLFSWINRALFIVVLVLQITVQFKNLRVKREWLLVILLVVIVHVYTFTNTIFPMYNVNIIAYLFFFVFLAMYFIDLKDLITELIKKNRKYILMIIRIWTVIVGVSVFFPSSYRKAWGGSNYFVSITGNPFRLAPTALMMISLVLLYFCLTKNRLTSVYMLVPLYSLFMCGSRTYLGVGLLVLMIYWYIFLSNKIVFMISLVPILIVLFFLVSNSSAGDKIAATTFSDDSYFDYWGTVTNGRTVFWEIDLKYFFKENFLNQLFGCGFNFDYVVTARYFSSTHWAHNDFIGIVMNYGYAGLGVYLYMIFKLIWTYVKNKRFTPIIIILVILVWFINAMFNMFYTYTCSMISFPLMLVGLNYYYGRGSKSAQI